MNDLWNRLLAVSALVSGLTLSLGQPLAQTPPAPSGGAELSVAGGPNLLEVARKDPKALIVFQYAEFDALVASGLDVDALRGKIVARMDDFVDFTEFSRLTIKEQWDELTDAQKVEYVGLFKQLIQRTYAKKFKPDRKLTVNYRGEAELKGDRARLETTIASGGIEADVEYRLHMPAGKDGWWVYDIVIDDVSLMRNYRSQFQRIVKADKVEGLFAKLREKVESGEE